MDSTLSSMPTCIISRCLMRPVPNTMALGGVATGSMKAQEAPMPITITSASLGRLSWVAMLANTGTSRAAEAVLLVNSVSMMMNAATARMTMNGCVVTNCEASA